MKLSRLALTTSLALGAVAVVATPLVLHAQSAAPPTAGAMQRWAPTPAQSAGTVARYILAPTGHVRGFVLSNGVAVFLGRGAGDTVAQQVPVGQAVRVQGFSHPNNPQIIRHATVSSPTGAIIVAARAPGPRMGAGAGAGHPAGPPHARGARRQRHLARLAALPTLTTRGTVQTVVAGHRGGARTILLSDGTTVALQRPMAHALRARGGVRVGETLGVSGRGGRYARGTAIVAERLSFADGTSVAAPLPPAPPVTPAAPNGGADAVPDTIEE